MSNTNLSALFNQMANILEILGEDRFQVNSYRKSARIIKELPEEVDVLLAEGRLADIPGVGKATVTKAQEFVDTGHIQAHDELLGRIPITLLDLFTLQGMGPKGIKAVYEQLEVTSIPELKAAIDDGSLQGLSGFGPKKCAGLLKAIAFREKAAGRIRLDKAMDVARHILAFLKEQGLVQKMQFAGSLRRCEETIGDIDILATPKQDVPAEQIIQAFTRADFVVDCLAAGSTKGSALVNLAKPPVQVDLRVVDAISFGAAKQYFTGSKEHNVHLRERAIKRDMKLNEYGLYQTDGTMVASETEKEIYQALGLDWVDPRLRQDRGEIEAAANHQLPHLIQAKDIRGDLHLHSTASDGLCELQEIAEIGVYLGYDYLCVTDHSISSAIANGLSPQRLEKHIEAIRTLNDQLSNITLLAGTEVDILSDGRLDYDDSLLAELDFVVASIHAGMSNDRDKGTRRILKAMDNPYVSCIGHCSTRLLGRREAMDLDMQAILKHAAKTHTAMEVNANPFRLDLNDLHCRQAINLGVKLVINTDAHHRAGFNLMEYGVATAARGWVTKKDVLNTLPLAELKAWVAGKR